VLWVQKPTKVSNDNDLTVVARSLNTLISLHRHILNNNNLAITASNPNRSLRSANTRRDLKEVVLGAGSSFPGLAVGGNLELRRAAVAVDDLRGEPVLRHAGFGVDGERARDFRAVDELVAGVDDAL
jgi:hypothetical protein